MQCIAAFLSYRKPIYSLFFIFLHSFPPRQGLRRPLLHIFPHKWSPKSFTPRITWAARFQSCHFLFQILNILIFGQNRFKIMNPDEP